MPRRGLPLLALILLGSLWAGQLAWRLPDLPDPLASHFDVSGRANGFASHGAYVALEACVLGGAALLFAALARWSRGAGARWINVPNRDHWFSEARRCEGSARLLDALLWLLAGQVAFVTALNQLVFDANLRGSPLSTAGVLGVMASAVLGLLGWSLYLYRLFPR